MSAEDGVRVEDGAGAIRRIDIAEFRRLGILQEVNRQFFHPLGLALEVVVEADGRERLGGVWDYREDPEGIVFGAGMLDPRGADYVESLRKCHVIGRRRLFGGEVQPCEEQGS